MIRLLRGAAKYERLAAPAAAAVAHGLRMVVNLIVIKFIAVLVGPVGLGTLGNLMSATTIVTLLAGGGILNGITKYVAEFSRDTARRAKFLESAMAYGLVASVVFLLISLLAAKPIAHLLIGRPNMAWVVPLLGITHFLCFCGGAIIAIVNGERRPSDFAKITIVAYLGVIPIAFGLIKFGGVTGAAVALLAVAASPAAPAFALAMRRRLLKTLRPRFHGEDVARLFRYTCIAVISSTTFPVTEIIIRLHLTDSLGVASTGIWQALTRLSGATLGFFTVYLATSHMPKLSAIEDRREATTAIMQGLRIVGPAFACCAALIYLLRSIIVPLLFSSAFQPMEDVIGWQLIGDLFRVCSYVVGFLGIAKAALKVHIAAELTQCLLYLAFTLTALHLGYGLREVAQAYALTYCIYFVVTLVALREYSRR